jgi:phytoene/squalene synthetase
MAYGDPLARSPLGVTEISDLEDAYTTCRQIAQSHYENFPVASRWVPEALRNPISAIYAFARTADDFADEGTAPPDERLRLLQDWRERLRECPQGNHKAHPVFLALSDSIRRFSLPLDPFERLITAFEMDVTQNRHKTFLPVGTVIGGINPLGTLPNRLC